MAKFLLDSDIIIYFLKGKAATVEEVIKHSADDLVTSRINYTELLYGAYNSARVESNLKTITQFLDNFEILEYTKEAAELFAKEKARLKKSGTIIADMDLMISSICIANGLTLVTNNIKHFERVKDLRIETWA